MAFLFPKYYFHQTFQLFKWYAEKTTDSEFLKLFKKFTEILAYMKNEGSDHQPEAGWLSYLFCNILLVMVLFYVPSQKLFCEFPVSKL